MFKFCKCPTFFGCAFFSTFSFLSLLIQHIPNSSLPLGSSEGDSSHSICKVTT